jgi:hypothetical protein
MGAETVPVPVVIQHELTPLAPRFSRRQTTTHFFGDYQYNASVPSGAPVTGEDEKAMASKVTELERRVLLLEQELPDLKEHLGNRQEAPWYRQILGQFKDDPAFDEIVRLGRQIRESQRKRAR